MKFKKAKLEEQKKLNEFIEEWWNDYLSWLNGYMRLYNYSWKRLNKCQAYYLDGYHYVFLKSYNTIVAVYDVGFNKFFDCLRYEYCYTATSAQHISKFYDLCNKYYNTHDTAPKYYRYYPV